MPVYGVAFSNSGTKIAYLSKIWLLIIDDDDFYHINLLFLAQDAKITIINLEKNSKDVISLGNLPMLQVKFISDNLLITTGHNYSPIVLGAEKSSGKW